MLTLGGNMNLTVQINVELVNENDDDELHKSKPEMNIINDDEYWNNDFYYDFGDGINKIINARLKDTDMVGVIRAWRLLER